VFCVLLLLEAGNELVLSALWFLFLSALGSGRNFIIILIMFL